MKSLTELTTLASKAKSKKKLVLAASQDVHALDAVKEATEAGLIIPVFVGNLPQIEQMAGEIGFGINDFIKIHEPDNQIAVEKSVKLIHDGEAQLLMKGSCGTAQLLKGVLNRDWGLRKGDLLSHFALFEIPAYHKLLAVTDVAINIAPDLGAKKAIIENSVEFLTNMGIAMPKVAVIAAVETVNDQMQATVDAAALVQMGRDGRIAGCLIEGPFGLDNAINKESAEHKGIQNEVAGDADLLLMPDIEAGNVFYKGLVYFARAEVASVVLGARAPVVLTSRSDSRETKLNSILLASAVDIV